MLHQVAAGVVGDHGVGHAVLAEFPGRQRGALVARAGFVDPDMDGDAGIVGLVDRRERGAPIDGGEPAGVAMGQDVDRARRWRPACDQRQPVSTDAPRSAATSSSAIAAASRVGGARRRSSAVRVAEPGRASVERPAQIDRGGAGGGQQPASRSVQASVEDRRAGRGTGRRRRWRRSAARRGRAWCGWRGRLGPAW